MPAKLTITQDNTANIKKAILDLARTTVHVGIPSEKASRKATSGKEQMTNATLGYIHEFGSPAHNIPARAWLVPGVVASKDKWTNYLEQAAKLAFEGKPASVDKALHAAGTTARDSVKQRISAGIAPPLAESTKQRRRGKHKNTKAGPSDLAPHFGGFTPLVDTAQMLNSITYALRKGK